LGERGRRANSLERWSYVKHSQGALASVGEPEGQLLSRFMGMRILII